MRDDQELLYIEDAQKRKLYYHFTPAAFTSNFVPLIVVLQADDKEEVLHFEYKMWNVLTPINSDGYNEKSSFAKELLQKLIERVADEYECEDHIYVYGSGKSANGAIAHGLLCHANAIWARDPKIGVNEIDLINSFKMKYNSLIIYLCDSEENVQSSVSDESKIFIEACKHNNIKVDKEFYPKPNSDNTSMLKKVLDMFEKVPSL
jgi:hypothetical protein